ncbi:MAG: hypothetical protein AAGJ84_07790 [Pseudomonadota bacterium]
MHTAIRAFFTLLPLASCGALSPEESAANAPGQEPVSIETISDAVAGAWRSEEERQRDASRRPVQTLEFFGLEQSDTVVEVWPGGGWYTNIIAPFLADGNGQLIAAHWDVAAAEGDRQNRLRAAVDQYVQTYSDQDLYGSIGVTAFSQTSQPFAASESVDAVLTFRNVHNWMSGDYTTKFFADAFDALKPGGVLGLVEHRLPSSQQQEPRALTGYVHEDYVISLATLSGFEFVASSEINANPNDTADHPFGVWTLPPVSRTLDADGNQPEGFNADVYAQIGESDRMTLKFIKPLEAGMENGSSDSGD